MSSDERLARRAAGGDRRAFEEIYERYHQDLYRFCLAMVGNPQDAQDALQNTMVKVLRGLPGEQRTIKLRPWLYRIARNESVETLRRRRDTAELESQQVAVAAVTETAETRERLRTLLADLEQLPERQRAALVMRELGGLDFDQIGAAFETSAAVARQTLYEARLSLRQLDAGREMRCADVMLELSNADGRVTRRREIRAHLRSCTECRAFRDDIDKRHEDLAALAPLPIAASAGLLQGVLGSGVGAGAAAGAGGGGLSAVGAGAGKFIASSALVKSVATIGVVAVGVSAANRTGAVDLPLPGGGNGPPAQETSEPGAIGAGNAASPANAPGSSTPPHDGGAAQGSPSENRSKGSNGSMASGESKSRRSSSRSQAGESPPGGGYGRSAAERKGQPEALPGASDKGQQTAATHKPSQATSPPSRDGTGASGGKSYGGRGAPKSKHASPPQAESAPAAPPAPDPPSAIPPKVETGAAHSGPPAAPGLER
jgi:RNA polymerase sigma factor (sigma-70 family)